MKFPVNSKQKILVVDDELDTLERLYLTLERDYEVIRAVSVPAALEILASVEDIAIIISSQHLCLASGREFLHLCATQYPYTVQIILVSQANAELVEAINAGQVFKYIIKPWAVEELKAIVCQSVDTYKLLKSRTREIHHALRQQSLLNSVTNTIRSALEYRQILQSIVDTVGSMLKVSYCTLRPFQDNCLCDELFVYQYSEVVGHGIGSHSTTVVEDSNWQLGSQIESNHGSDLSEANLKNIQNILPPTLLMATVWETRQVIIINNPATDERIQGNNPEIRQRKSAYQEANISSSLLVPLLIQQELMAVLALHQCNQPRVWQGDEIKFAIAVADEAAIAVSQARAYERISALAQREALINTITKAIRSSLDPQDIFAAITQQLGEALQVDSCALSLWTEEDEFVQCVGLYDKTKSESLNPLPQSYSPIAGNPVLQQLLKTQQPVVIDDLSQQPHMRGLDLPLRSPFSRALLVVPLFIDGKSIGSITLRQVNQPRWWNTDEVELAQAVAAQAAIAVQQSRLYQKSRSLAERLLELDRQKTQFFQNISHEFRTPLTLMLGPLESAVAQQQDFPLDQAAIALRNSRRLLRLVNQLLDLQRLDAGRMPAIFRPCDLVEFVSQIVDSFRPYCEKKGLQLVTELNPCPHIHLDMEKFDKVLYNLLSNAMKFTSAGGRITVRVEAAGNHCVLWVRDTGIGIRTEQIPYIFERFRQVDGAANRLYEGSGLGLALAKELVEIHGGQISVESVYGQGSTFIVWLPTGTTHLPFDQVLDVSTQLQPRRAAVELADLEVVEEAEIAEVGDHRSTQMLGEEKKFSSPPLISATSASILVVDDNPDLRAYVCGILRSHGYQVHTALNGAEGFRLAQACVPDLIVTDLMMPLVSGMEMMRLLRSQDKLKGIPVILLTAKTDEETRILGTEGGADAYLAKPFNERELLATVRNLLALKENERRVVELNNYLTESVLKRFLPPAMVKKAATGELKLDLSPEPRLITILFSDIVGFTQLSNTLRSRRVAELLNEYLETMTRAVFDNGGTVDKFMGDAILAIFGAPEEISPNEQVRRAIATAKAMHHSLSLLNQRWISHGVVRKEHNLPIQFRCGIHQGTAVVGMFGSVERTEYTAIGTSVNIAARLQQAAAPGQILVSAAVADYLEENEINKCSPLALKGVDETVLTFSVKPEKNDDQ